jgi:recombination protein RecA
LLCADPKGRLCFLRTEWRSDFCALGFTPRPESRPGTPLVHVWSYNQLRQKIGVVYGNPETTTGGNALKFYASVRLDIRKTGVVKNGEQAVGNKTRVKVVKNKVAPPFREREFEITYGTSISTASEIVDLASEAGLLEESGAYYSWSGERIAQGRDKACQYMSEHAELAAELRDKLGALRKAEN